MLIYQNDYGRIEMEQDITAPFFVDPNDCQLNIKSGNFDTQRFPGMDGTTTYDVSLSHTQMRISGTIYLYNIKPVLPADEQFERTKQFLYDLFNPRLNGILYWKSGRRTYRIKNTRSIGAPVIQNYMSGTAGFTVELISDEAYWEHDDPFIAALGFTHGGLTLPTTLPCKFGLYYGGKANIYNDTAHKVYPTVTFFANNAGFRVVNQTIGEFLELEKEIDINQKIVIETSPQIATATVYRQDGDCWVEVEDASQYITLDSGNLYLARGNNELVVESGVAGRTPSAIIEWRRPFTGV